MPDRSYLLAILVYNGRDVVPRCLESAARLVGDRVRVVVFDDCSPSEGWSEDVSKMCSDRGIGYYRTPRNLGIPRNMSLAMKTALAEGFDIVGLVNSDVVLPQNLIASMDTALDANPGVGSITPWSNNVSAFSLPMSGATHAIAEQSFVDDLAGCLADQHGGEVIAVPTGVGYCLIIPTDAVRRVGVMDPIFGRGYCEEVDWCQRAHLAGLPNVLSLGSFVYHEGSGTNRDEGLLAHGMTTVVEHELIILDRYPDYGRRVEGFLAASALTNAGRAALNSALSAIVRKTPYRLVVEAYSSGYNDTLPTVSVNASTRQATVSMFGLQTTVDLGEPPILEAVLNRFGQPASVVVADGGDLGNSVAGWARDSRLTVVERTAYPVSALGSTPTTGRTPEVQSIERPHDDRVFDSSEPASRTEGNLLKKLIRRLSHSPGVPQARHVAERSVAPFLRHDLHDLGRAHAETENRMAAAEVRLQAIVDYIDATKDDVAMVRHDLRETQDAIQAIRGFTDVVQEHMDGLPGMFDGIHSAIRALEMHQPTILNSIASSNGTARLLMREKDRLADALARLQAEQVSTIEELSNQDEGLSERLVGVAAWIENESQRVSAIEKAVDATAKQLSHDLQEHVGTIGWLLQRVETVRAEMMHELRYGPKSVGAETDVEPRIINPGPLGSKHLKVNLGAGHIPIDGYVNVDIRELPGIDVVAAADRLPFEPSSVGEFFSSHTIEHFPVLSLQRQLLPYWLSLLKPGGVFRAVVPDVEAMAKGFADGSISFENLREVVYGGQEYEGDFHFAGFSPSSLGQLLTDAGLTDLRVIASGRPNGACLEFEISAKRPAH